MEQNEIKEYRINESISYSLTKDEALECLKKAKIFKTTGTRANVFCIVLGICAVVFFVDFIINWDFNPLFFSIFSLVMIAVVLIVPNIYLNRLAKENSNGKLINAEVTDEKITINTEAESWSIALDNTSAMTCEKDCYIFFTPHKQIFAIPKRVISKENSQRIDELFKEKTNEYN